MEPETGKLKQECAHLQKVTVYVYMYMYMFMYV